MKKKTRRLAYDRVMAGPEAAKRWLGLCERYERIIAVCWRDECERRDRELLERHRARRAATRRQNPSD